VIGNVDQWDYRNISGWVVDERRPDDILSVELRFNGAKACLIAARLYREDLKQLGFGHGNHGFAVDPRPYLTNKLNYVEVIVAGKNILLGARNVIDMDLADLLEISQIRWKGDEALEGLTWGRAMTGDSFVDVILSHLRPDEGMRVLEVGPGYGRILSTLLQREIPLKSYWGVEISAARTARLREQFTDKRVRFENGDINTYKFRDSADLIISSSTFLHFYPNCSQALKNIRKQISRNTLVAIDFMDPAHYPPDRGFDHTSGIYYVFYSREELSEIFRESGLKVVLMHEYLIGLGDTRFGNIFGLMVIARPNQ
jgi:SAM-dependent methyltransferase